MIVCAVMTGKELRRDKASWRK